ncbi:MAG: hypothetical protein WBP26_03310 [Candidatus Saccharimonadales bacterium]
MKTVLMAIAVVKKQDSILLRKVDPAKNKLHRLSKTAFIKQLPSAKRLLL